MVVHGPQAGVAFVRATQLNPLSAPLNKVWLLRSWDCPPRKQALREVCI